MLDKTHDHKNRGSSKAQCCSHGMEYTLIILMDIPISANHCEVLMQSQIRYKREELDSYTIKWSVSW